MLDNKTRAKHTRQSVEKVTIPYGLNRDEDVENVMLAFDHGQISFMNFTQAYVTVIHLAFDSATRDPEVRNCTRLSSSTY